MNFKIKNTLNGKSVKDAITCKPLVFASRVEAEVFASKLAHINAVQAHFSLKTTKFSYSVVAA